MVKTVFYIFNFVVSSIVFALDHRSTKFFNRINSLIYSLGSTLCIFSVVFKNLSKIPLEGKLEIIQNVAS